MRTILLLSMFYIMAYAMDEKQYVVNLIEKQMTCVKQFRSLDIDNKQLIDLVKGTAQLEMALELGLIPDADSQTIQKTVIMGDQLAQLTLQHLRSK